jgi:hypothetical protein
LYLELVELEEAYPLVSMDAVRAKSTFFARPVGVPFYRAKGTIYNAWLTDAYIVPYGKIPSQGSQVACSGRLKST